MRESTGATDGGDPDRNRDQNKGRKTETLEAMARPWRGGQMGKNRGRRTRGGQNTVVDPGIGAGIGGRCGSKSVNLTRERPKRAKGSRPSFFFIFL